MLTVWYSSWLSKYILLNNPDSVVALNAFTFCGRGRRVGREKMEKYQVVSQHPMAPRALQVLDLCSLSDSICFYSPTFLTLHLLYRPLCCPAFTKLISSPWDTHLWISSWLTCFMSLFSCHLTEHFSDHFFENHNTPHSSLFPFCTSSCTKALATF